MLKIPQTMLRQLWAKKFQMYKLSFKESEESVIKLPTFIRSWRKKGSSRKTSISASLTILKPLTVWVTTTCGKFLKWWEYQTTLLVPWETCIQVKKQYLELDMEQLTGSTLWKGYKSVYCHPIDLNYMKWVGCVSYPTLWEPMYWSPPASSVHKISQERILEWVAIFSCRRSSQCRECPCICSWIHVFMGRFFTTEPSGKPRVCHVKCQAGWP